MTSIPSTSALIVKPVPNYTGVKIKVNNPTVSSVHSNKNSGNYNAVDIEVNNPKIVDPAIKPVYIYPKAKDIVTYDMLGLNPANIPSIPIPPVAYTTINNSSLISTDIVPALDEKAENPEKKTHLPKPNITTVEAEKNPSFHGLDKVEIIKPENIKPEVDINTVISKLADKNFDVQAIQMEKIAKTAIQEPVKAVPYIVTNVYSGLIDIINADTSNLAKPTEQQIETRKKIILNEIVKAEAKKAGKDPKTVELPFNLTKEELAEAVKLAPFEQAERNKEYAIMTSALLTKIYIDENRKETGIVLSITDLPAVSDYVNILRNSNNPDTKMTAIDGLMYLKRPEYAEELKAIFELASNDSNPSVARYAQKAAQAVSK